MATRVDSSARVQPTEGRYLAVPGSCAICGKVPSHMEEIFANPQAELEQYGALYFCQACCLELSAFVMAVPIAVFDKVVAANVELSDRNVFLLNQVDYLREILNARIDSAGAGQPVHDDSSASSVDVPVSKVELAADDVNQLIDSLEPIVTESSPHF